jgi:hypothetical protein
VAAEYEVNIKLNTQQIERELKKVDRAVNSIGKGKGGKKQPILALPSTDQLSAATRKIKELDGYNRKIHLTQKQINKQTRDQALSIDTLVKTQEKRARLLNKINEMEAKGLNVSKLRKQLAKATTEQSARRFGSAEKEFRILEKSIRLEQSKLRILKEQRKGFPSSPVRGTPAMMGSPAQIAASGRQAVSPIGGRIDIAGSPAQMEAIRKLEMAEIRADKNAHFAELKLIQKRQKIELDNVDKLLAADLRALDKFDRRLEASDRARQKRLAGAPIPGLRGRTFGPSPAFAGRIASPIAGTAGTPGSPEFNRALEIGRLRSSPIQGRRDIAGSPEARRLRRQRLEQVGLGAGFPLLFGGGAGSVIGGAAGGLTGSFGAQIAFSAIGQQIDQFVASMVDAGKALTSVGGAADFMAEKSLFSSDAMQFRIEKLIEEGQVTEAAALMTQEMAKQVGGSGLKALKDLGTEASKMGKLFNALILQVQAFISRALTPLLAAINKVVGDIVLNNQFNALMSEATGARAKEIEEFLKPFTKTARKGAAAKDVVTSEGKRLAVERFGGQVIPEGAGIEPTQLELLRAADTPKRKTRESRVPELQIEVSLTERLNALNRQVLEAKRAENPVREAALKMEIALEEQAAGIQKINNKKIPQEEKNLQIKKLELQTDQKIFEINDKFSASRAAQAEKNEKILADLQSQNDLLQAKLDGRLKEEEIEQRIRDLAEDNQGLDEKAVRNLLEKNKLLNEQIAAAEQLDQLYQSIGNTIANGVVNALEGAVMGTQSLADAASSMLNNLARQMLQIATNMALFGNMGGTFESGSGLFGTIAQGIISGFSGGLGSGGDGSGFVTTTDGLTATANGNAFGRNGVVPFARGGVVNRPTLFPFANGTGLMGEAGPEAIMPLRRSPDGRLGVEASGGGAGPTNIVVNVDASGSNVEGDSQQQKALGKAIGLAVQSEIAKQKRPGGLLS